VLVRQCVRHSAAVGAGSWPTGALHFVMKGSTPSPNRLLPEAHRAMSMLATKYANLQVF
jgi:hypothetical protein